MTRRAGVPRLGSSILKDMSGRIRGKLTPIMPISQDKHRRIVWLFQCECGRTKAMRTDTKAKSCGHCGRRMTGHSPGSGFRQRIQEELRVKQGNKCAICNKPFVKTPQLDHDHNCCPNDLMCEKCIRGALCGVCNKGLGLFKDSIELLISAVEYLRRFQCR